MTFEYDSINRRAVDNRSGAIMRRTSLFTDVANLSIYEISAGDLRIRFELYHCGELTQTDSGTKWVDTGALILEPALHSFFAKNVNKIGRISSSYQEFLNFVEDGVLSVNTRDGTGMPKKSYSIQFVQKL